MRTTYRVALALFGASLVPSACCYPTPPPYVPNGAVTDFSLPMERWVYVSGRVNARNDAEQAMATQGFALANAVLLSDCFQQGVLEAPMTHTDGQLPGQIYMTMTDGVRRLEIEFYDGGTAHHTVGSEDPRRPGIVRMNRHYVNSAYMVADNLLHEAAHVRGYIHKSSKEAESVPYTMNRIFEACAVNANAQHVAPVVISDSADED
jgi:hypothetical protein